MRSYGVIHTSFYTSETTRRLSDRAFRLAVYLISGPHTSMIGCFYLPGGYVCEDLGWSPETLSEGFRELLAKGFVTRDERLNWVFVTNFLKFNGPENPNQAKAMMKAFDRVPDGLAAKSQLAKRLNEQLAKFPGCKVEPNPNPSETVSEGYRNTESESESESYSPLPPIGGDASSSTTKPSRASRPKTDAEADPRFSQFWEVYPRKVAKAGAAKAFEKLDPSPELLVKILAAVAVQSRSDQWLKDGGAFIPHPATWLNGRRWEDQAVTAVVAPRSTEPLSEEASLQKILAAATANGPSWSEIRRGGDA